MLGEVVALPAGEVAVSAFLFLSYCIALGLLWVYRSTISKILLGLANKIDDVAIPVRITTIRPLAPMATALRFVDGEIRHGLGLAVLSTERGAAWLWGLAARQIAWVGDEIAELAWSVAQAFTHTTTITIPHAARNAQHGVIRRIRKAEAAAAAAAAAGTLALHRFEAVVTGRIRGMDKDLSALKKRVVKAERKLAGAGAIAFVGATIARMGLGWLRCRNVRKAGKQVCGMDYDILSALLAGTLAVWGAVSLVEFVKELETLTDAGTDALKATIKEF